MMSKLILLLVISSLIIGCIDSTKIPSIPKSEPCVQQTSPDGKMTITRGDCKGKLPEDKLVGTWTLKTDVLDSSFTFNSDQTGSFRTQLWGNIYFNWNVVNDKIIITDSTNQALFPGYPMPKVNEKTGQMTYEDGISYKLINNDRTLIIMGLSFEKSWW